MAVRLTVYNPKIALAQLPNWAHGTHTGTDRHE